MAGRGIPPESAWRQSVTYYVLARIAAAFVWLWHGVVPKLIFIHGDELSPLLAAGFSARRPAKPRGKRPDELQPASEPRPHS